MLNREEMLRDIMMFDFAVQEATLFLDTHPNDQNAFQYYKEASERLDKAQKAYAKNFGSLNNRVVSGNTYNYVNAPWPWEGDKSCGCMKKDCNFQ